MCLCDCLSSPRHKPVCWTSFILSCILKSVVREWGDHSKQKFLLLLKDENQNKPSTPCRPLFDFLFNVQQTGDTQTPSTQPVNLEPLPLGVDRLGFVLFERKRDLIPHLQAKRI